MSKFLFVFCIVAFAKNAAAQPSGCDAETVEMDAYYDWPLTLQCNDLVWDIFYADYDTELGCTIINMGTGEVLLNASTTIDFDEEEYIHPNPEDFQYIINDVSEWTDTKYEIVASSQINPTACLAQIVELNITDFIEQTCDESLEAGEVTLDDVEKEVGERTELLCDVPGHFDGPKELVDSDTAQTHWLYNCGRELPSNTIAHPSKPHALLMTSISYQTNPGVYTCVVEHRDMVRYRIHYKVCVKDEVSREMTIQCPNYKVAIGEDVKIECDVDAGLGIENSFVFHSFFNKLDEDGKVDRGAENVSCTSTVYNNETVSPDTRVSCGLEMITTGAIKCFYAPPTEEEYQSQRTALKIFYKIRNVQSSDFGKYEATINRLQKRNSTMFRLELDKKPGLERSTVIILICISVLVGCGLFVLMVFILCGIEIRWVWKRSFGSRESELKKYAAYLAYYYNKDMPETSPTDLDAFVKNLDTRVRRLGGILYDKCRDHNTKQYIAENIHSRLTECHRVIIILTPEYIRDQWSVYEAYEAWKNVIEHGIPIIFITFPTTESAILSLPTESRIALHKALKRHSVIEWNGNFPFTRRMRMRLEILMPRLPQESSVDLPLTDDINEEVVAVKMHNGETANGGLDNNKNVFENAV